MSVELIELNDVDWELARDEMCRRFLGISATEFVQRFNAGDFAAEEPSGLMTVLAFFPELD